MKIHNHSEASLIYVTIMLFIVMTCVSGSPKVGNKKDDSSQSATSDPNSSSESGNQAVDSSARSESNEKDKDSVKTTEKDQPKSESKLNLQTQLTKSEPTVINGEKAKKYDEGTETNKEVTKTGDSKQSQIEKETNSETSSNSNFYDETKKSLDKEQKSDKKVDKTPSPKKSKKSMKIESTTGQTPKETKNSDNEETPKTAQTAVAHPTKDTNVKTPSTIEADKSNQQSGDPSELHSQLENLQKDAETGLVNTFLGGVIKKFKFTTSAEYEEIRATILLEHHAATLARTHFYQYMLNWNKIPEMKVKHKYVGDPAQQQKKAENLYNEGLFEELYNQIKKACVETRMSIASLKHPLIKVQNFRTRFSNEFDLEAEAAVIAEKKFIAETRNLLKKALGPIEESERRELQEDEEAVKARARVLTNQLKNKEDKKPMEMREARDKAAEMARQEMRSTWESHNLFRSQWMGLMKRYLVDNAIIEVRREENFRMTHPRSQAVLTILNPLTLISSKSGFPSDEMTWQDKVRALSFAPNPKKTEPHSAAAEGSL